MKDLLNNWKLVILICLALGMAPFFPEPHLWGKLKWVAGGATGMKTKDWFDILLHGTPFVLLYACSFCALKTGLRTAIF